MAPVAIHAGRGQGVSPGLGLAVERLAVLPGLTRVTGGTVDRGDVGGRMGKGEVLMAEGAGDPSGAVHRRGEIRGADEELLGILGTLKQGWIAVAHEAHVVVLSHGQTVGEKKSQHQSRTPNTEGKSSSCQAWQCPLFHSRFNQHF